MSSDWTLSDWMAHVCSLHCKEIELGLDRVRKVWLRLCPEFEAPFVVVVAGTNGKGSCASALETIALASGLSVCCYTSPHLFCVNERIRVSGKEIDDACLVDIFAQIEAVRAEIPLTYFEFLTLAALQYFAQFDAALWILEVGLGGRLDAVNMIDADIAVVTNIALDHCDWLGNNRESIGEEKAGVFRPQRPALCADPQPPKSLRLQARAREALWRQIGVDFHMCCKDGSWQFQTSDGQGIECPSLSIPPGSVAAALEAFALSPFELPEHTGQWLAKLTLPGRMQRESDDGVQWIFDVAHNPQACVYLAEQLDAEPCAGNLHVIFGALADKDHRGMVSALPQRAAHWHVTGLDDLAAVSHRDLAQLIQSMGRTLGSVSSDILSAMRHVQSISVSGDRVLVMGSFRVVAPALRHFAERLNSKSSLSILRQATD